MSPFEIYAVITAVYSVGWFWLGFPCGILLVLGLVRTSLSFKFLCLSAVVFISLIVLLPHLLSSDHPHWHISLFLAEFLAAALASVWATRRFADLTQVWRPRWSRHRHDTSTDIRTVRQLLPEAGAVYDPLTFCDDPQSIFAGLDPQGQAVRIDQAVWRQSHVDIVGMTGTGKGVLAGVLLTQAIRQGEAVIAIDPKNDEYAPHVLARAAAEAGVPYYHLDLMADEPLWHPLRDKTTDEIEELLVACFGLGERGTEADFYRLHDRQAARTCAEMFDGEPLPALLRQIQTERIARDAKKFMADLAEISSTPAAQASIDSGVDLTQAVAEGAVIYVRGALRHARILKLQKMFVLSVIQHCERRPREDARHVCLFLDELRYLISAPVLEALASIRDKRAHLVMTHQTLNDLRNVPADIDPAQVVSSVTENCLLKFTYRVNDPDTALWLARMSGHIQAYDEARNLEADLVLTERETDMRNVRQTQRHLIDTNMLLSLPARCAVYFGEDLARFVSTSPVAVTKDANDLRSLSGNQKTEV